MTLKCRHRVVFTNQDVSIIKVSVVCLSQSSTVLLHCRLFSKSVTAPCHCITVFPFFERPLYQCTLFCSYGIVLVEISCTSQASLYTNIPLHILHILSATDRRPSSHITQLTSTRETVVLKLVTSPQCEGGQNYLNFVAVLLLCQ